VETVSTLVGKSDEYIQGLLNGDQYIVNLIFVNYKSQIVDLLKLKGATTEEAEDVCMISLEAIYFNIKFKNLTLIKASFKTYLTQICLNQWYKIFRQKKLQSMSTFDETLIEEVDSLEDTLIQLERIKLINEKMKLLPQLCQQLFELIYVFENSTQEIAIKLNSTEVAIRKRKHDCKEKLLEMVQNSPLFDELK
jgi:RNA polymerase sigma factor (sigma-70 family)